MVEIFDRKSSHSDGVSWRTVSYTHLDVYKRQDYGLYNYPAAIGFLTRGCVNRCPWCVVPRKEGALRGNADIEEFLDGRRNAVLLDNNVLASGWGLEQIEKIIRLGVRVDFNQGLDALSLIHI